MVALIPVNTLGDNARPFSVFTSVKNFHRISLKSVGLYTVLRSTVIFLFSHQFFYSPLSCSLGVFHLS